VGKIDDWGDYFSFGSPWKFHEGVIEVQAFVSK